MMSLRRNSGEKKVLAIDGTAASGKGTLAQSLAKHFGFNYIDSGRLYRLVAWRYLRELPEDSPLRAALACRLADDLDADVDDDDLRGDDVTRVSSKLAVFATVRRRLNRYQRSQVRSFPSGTVVDGRDIGTVVFPQTNYKIFVDADIKVRAERRYREMMARHLPANLPFIEAAMRRRDHRDQSRTAAPLRPAFDACLLDSSNKTTDQVLGEALSYLARQGLSR